MLSAGLIPSFNGYRYIAFVSSSIHLVLGQGRGPLQLVTFAFSHAARIKRKEEKEWKWNLNSTLRKQRRNEKKIKFKSCEQLLIYCVWAEGWERERVSYCTRIPFTRPAFCGSGPSLSLPRHVYCPIERLHHSNSKSPTEKNSKSIQKSCKPMEEEKKINYMEWKIEEKNYINNKRAITALTAERNCFWKVSVWVRELQQCLNENLVTKTKQTSCKSWIIVNDRADSFFNDQ